MNLDFTGRLQRVTAWARAARAAGWLTDGDVERLDRLETASAGDLFEKRERRPLIVGLFGGTGVGKSSLLNRLAGEAIAEVGVERPTSTHATIYLHRSQNLNALPDDSPIAATVVRYHGIDSRRDVAWLDMPDIDSVERGNRDLALAWLPYVDWLIYVVSPERYRDDAGWRLIQQRRHRHHWLFVINRWDQAKEVQLDAFARDLEAAGFSAPCILRTSCSGGPGYDFDRLQNSIDKAIDEHGLAELQRIGALARLRDLDAVAQWYRRKLGAGGAWQQLERELRHNAGRRLEMFGKRLEAELEQIVQRYPDAPGWWRGEVQSGDLPRIDIGQVVWSPHCDDLLDNIRSDALIAADAGGVAREPLIRRLSDVLSTAREGVVGALEDGLRTALAQPGTPFGRGLRRLSHVVAYALPLAAAAWVLYNVAAKYREALAGEADFLGLDFAVHSLLLVGLAWLVPFLIGRWARPSWKTAARRGLRNGLRVGITSLERRLVGAWESLRSERDALLEDFPD